jgi:hypothetical protein
VGSPILQTFQEPILLQPWLFFVVAKVPLALTRRGELRVQEELSREREDGVCAREAWAGARSALQVRGHGEQKANRDFRRVSIGIPKVQ